MTTALSWMKTRFRRNSRGIPMLFNAFIMYRRRQQCSSKLKDQLTPLTFDDLGSNVIWMRPSLDRKNSEGMSRLLTNSNPRVFALLRSCSLPLKQRDTTGKGPFE